MNDITADTITMSAPYYFAGDCARIPLEDNSVDLVFCSPPYEAARTYGIDFKLRGQDWVDWAVVRYLECLRVSRGLVAWVCEGQTRQYAYSAAPVLLMADLHRRGVKLRKPPIYRRVGIPGSGGPDWLRNDYEFIVCATKDGKLPWSDNTACGHPPKYATGGSCSNRHADGRRANLQKYGDEMGNKPSKRRRGYAKPKLCNPGNVIDCEGDRVSRLIEAAYTLLRVIEYETGLPDTAANGVVDSTGRDEGVQCTAEAINDARQAIADARVAGNVIDCKVGGGQMGHPLAHENEAPFPLTLAEFFVKSFCPPGGIVLDPFGGSGTTAHAAILHGRRAIHMDIRESQTQLARRRIDDVLEAMVKEAASCE